MFTFEVLISNIRRETALWERASREIARDVLSVLSNRPFRQLSTEPMSFLTPPYQLLDLEALTSREI